MKLGEPNRGEPNLAEFLRGNEGATRPNDLAKNGARAALKAAKHIQACYAMVWQFRVNFSPPQWSAAFPKENTPVINALKNLKSSSKRLSMIYKKLINGREQREPTICQKASLATCYKVEQ